MPLIRLTDHLQPWLFMGTGPSLYWFWLVVPVSLLMGVFVGLRMIKQQQSISKVVDLTIRENQSSYDLVARDLIKIRRESIERLNQVENN